VLLGILIAYIAAAIFKVRDYTGNTTGTPFTVWPSWGWIVAIIASVLWFLVGMCASCEDFHRTPHASEQSCFVHPQNVLAMKACIPSFSSALASQLFQPWYHYIQMVSIVEVAAAHLLLSNLSPMAPGRTHECDVSSHLLQ
jgi:hypothetical protein